MKVNLKPKDRPYTIKAVLFDFDGTLTHPGAIDFAGIRNDIGCPEGVPILEFIDELPFQADRESALAEVDRHEIAAAAMSVPNAGAEVLIRDLKHLDLKIGVITRNSRAAIEKALENFEATAADDFHLVISRDDPFTPKPEPDSILAAAHKLAVLPETVMVVGDFVFDIDAGHAAGAITTFLTNGDETKIPDHADFTVHRLEEVLPLVHMGLPLKAGKLPHHYLESFLGDCVFDDLSVLARPGVGEDIAAVNVENEDVLVLTSDPITFTAEKIGEYAVLVNANDIATAGAVPRWLLTTLLFPMATTPSMVRHVMAELTRVCRRWGITLCGGHTEITDAVTRPIVTGMMAGTVKKDRFLDKSRMRPGDLILLTKGVAVEGTAIIAAEFEDRLTGLKVPKDVIDRAKGFLSHIGILEEARIASETPGVKAMHDVTEGGLATALEEFSIAGGYGIRVHMKKIPVFPETQTLSRALGVDPLGLIGSGSLLICCRPEIKASLMGQIRDAGIDTACIGEVLNVEPGIAPVSDGDEVNWPRFDVDEVARLFNSDDR